MEPKWMQNGGKIKSKRDPISRFRKKVPNVSSTHYLLCITTIGTLQKPHFLAPRGSQNAGPHSVVPPIPPRGCKMAPTGPKNGESGVPREHQGCQRVPQCLQNAPKNNRKSAPLSRTASKGAFRVPWVPQRLQNTSISDVPPTDVTPRRGNVHLLSAIPHSQPTQPVFWPGRVSWENKRMPCLQAT